MTPSWCRPKWQLVGSLLVFEIEDDIIASMLQGGAGGGPLALAHAKRLHFLMILTGWLHLVVITRARPRRRAARLGVAD